MIPGGNLRRIHFMEVPDGDLSRLDRLDGLGSPKRRTGPNGVEYNPQHADTWDAPDEEKVAQLAALVDVHTSTVDPGTSEKVNPRTAAAFWWGFGSASVLAAGLWALSTLTGAVL